jgi:hypothetical protein
VCISHGAETTRCSIGKCAKGAIKGGVCVAHGARTKRCSTANCKKQAQRRGVCIAHGAKITTMLRNAPLFAGDCQVKSDPSYVQV